VAYSVLQLAVQWKFPFAVRNIFPHSFLICGLDILEAYDFNLQMTRKVKDEVWFRFFRNLESSEKNCAENAGSNLHPYIYRNKSYSLLLRPIVRAARINLDPEVSIGGFRRAKVKGTRGQSLWITLVTH
jgi:hypothetical protein